MKDLIEKHLRLNGWAVNEKVDSSWLLRDGKASEGNKAVFIREDDVRIGLVACRYRINKGVIYYVSTRIKDSLTHEEYIRKFNIKLSDL